ncbi:MAG: hypothetical protein RLZZ08_260 [Pseudomonadota bacterium]|jgi:hypothetical protein
MRAEAPLRGETALFVHQCAKMPVGMAGALVYQPRQVGAPGGSFRARGTSDFFGFARFSSPVEPVCKAR